jgi:N-acetylneuraminic acid mutarotase
MVSVSFGEGGEWDRKADMPTGRAALSVDELNGKIYAIGGIIPGSFSAKTEEYDPELDKWTTKADMLINKCGHTTTAVNGKMYVIGGYNGQTLSSIEEYDPMNNTWKNKTTMPGTKMYHSAVAINNMIYVLGGWANANNLTPSLSVFSYDPAIDQWSRLKDIPEGYAIAETVVVAIDNKVYCFGGINPTNFIMYKNVLVYDVQNERWSTKAELLSVRSLGVAAIIGRKVYFIGGELPFQAWSGVSNVEEYDIDTNTVEKKADMPHRRGYIAGCAIDNKVFVIGGTTDFPGDWPNDYLTIVEEYTPGNEQFSVYSQEKLSSTWGNIKYGR